jgi:hypothetical protein
MFAEAFSAKYRPELSERREQARRVLGVFLRNKPTKSFCFNTLMFGVAGC